MITRTASDSSLIFRVAASASWSGPRFRSIRITSTGLLSRIWPSSSGEPMSHKVTRSGSRSKSRIKPSRNTGWSSTMPRRIRRGSSQFGPRTRSGVSLHDTPDYAFRLLITRLYIDHKPVWIAQPERPVAAGPVVPEPGLTNSLEFFNPLDLAQGRVPRTIADDPVD